MAASSSAARSPVARRTSSRSAAGWRRLKMLNQFWDTNSLNIALRIKTNSVRGGAVEGVYMRDVTVGEVAEAVVTIDYFYEEGDAGKFPPIVRDVEVRNVTSRKSKYGLLLRGYAHDPIADVRLIDCRFDGVAEGDVIEAVRDLARTNVVVNGSAVNDRVTR